MNDLLQKNISQFLTASVEFGCFFGLYGIWVSSNLISAKDNNKLEQRKMEYNKYTQLSMAHQRYQANKYIKEENKISYKATKKNNQTLNFERSSEREGSDFLYKK